MNGEVDRALRDCLEMIEAGEGELACLARYPEHAAELSPMLMAAGDLRALRSSQLTPAVRLEAKASLGRAAAARRPRSVAPRVHPWWGLPAARGLLAAAATLLLIVLSAGLAVASRPGDAAYGLRLAIERVPIWLAAPGEARANADLEFAERRLEDVHAALRVGRARTGGTRRPYSCRRGHCE